MIVPVFDAENAHLDFEDRDDRQMRHSLWRALQHVFSQKFVREGSSMAAPLG
jgi:hypothetical protein